MNEIAKVKRVKKAILLSAGFGTRLKPITDHIPKCLVPINGKPLLQVWLEQLSQVGFSEFLINTHYLAEEVKKFIENSAFKDQIVIFHENEILGTLGTLKATQAFWAESDVLIVHADNLCLCDWDSFIDTFHRREKDCFGSLMLFETDTPQSCGIVELDERNYIKAFHEKIAKPPSNLANAAVYLFDKHVNNMLSTLNDDESDISYHLMPYLIAKVNGWVNTGYMRDIGTPESLATANVDVKKLFESY